MDSGLRVRDLALLFFFTTPLATTMVVSGRSITAASFDAARNFGEACRITRDGRICTGFCGQILLWDGLIAASRIDSRECYCTSFFPVSYFLVGTHPLS